MTLTTTTTITTTTNSDDSNNNNGISQPNLLVGLREFYTVDTTVVLATDLHVESIARQKKATHFRLLGMLHVKLEVESGSHSTEPLLQASQGEVCNNKK